MKAATLSVERSITTSVTAEGNRDAPVREKNSTEAMSPASCVKLRRSCGCADRAGPTIAARGEKMTTFLGRSRHERRGLVAPIDPPHGS